MFKRMLIMLILVALVAGSIYGFKQFKSSMIKHYMGQMSKQPQTVAAVEAKAQVWTKDIDAVGSFVSTNGVNISTEVAGILDGLYGNAGDHVTEGTLVAKLRADDDIAYLNALKADARLARVTLERDNIQMRDKAIAQATIDVDQATLDRALALVAQQEAVIAKKFIRAPFAGQLGISPVGVGQYITPGTSIVPLQQLDPIFFDFFLPQQALAVVQVGQKVMISANVDPNHVFEGKMLAINSQVDPTSRNIQVRAIVNNPKTQLLPGMYGTIQVETGISNKYITLPVTAITYNPYGNTVFIAKPSGTDSDGKVQYVADQRFVTVGASRGDQIAITSGLEPGELVVVAGQMKLQKGAPLNINNTVLPSDESNPQLTDLQ